MSNLRGGRRERVVRKLLPGLFWLRSLRGLIGGGSDSVPRRSADFSQNVKEVYFPFNIYNRMIDKAVFDSNAAWLKQHPDAQMWIQGYADPRGDIVYNLVLSYRRAQWVKASWCDAASTSRASALPPDGESCIQNAQADDDQCFQQNRRVDVVPPEYLLFHLSGL